VFLKLPFSSLVRANNNGRQFKLELELINNSHPPRRCESLALTRLQSTWSIVVLEKCFERVSSSSTCCLRRNWGK